MNQQFLRNGARVVVIPFIAIAIGTWGILLAQLLPWTEIGQAILYFFWLNN